MPSKGIIPVRIRMPRDLHKKIQKEAEQHAQTINAEILTRLEGSFELMQLLKRINGVVREMRYEELPRISQDIRVAMGAALHIAPASNAAAEVFPTTANKVKTDD